MNQDILYPYAGVAGEVVHIDNAEKSQQFVCLGCNQAMRPVKGEKRAWHFRHLPDAKCDPDNALHRMAQRIVAQSFKSAVEKKQEYRLTLMCKNCGEAAMDRNAASPSATITVEDTSLISGTRPDLVIREADGRVTILEVVVTHALENKTRLSYKESGIPILFKTFKEFDDLKGLDSSFAADSSLNTEDLCEKCKADDERRKLKEFDVEARRDQDFVQRQSFERPKRKESDVEPTFTADSLINTEDVYEKCEAAFERRKRIVDQAVARMKSRPSTAPRFERRLFKTPKAMANAKILSKLGFQQSKKDPLLFGFPIHIHQGKSIHFCVRIIGGSNRPWPPKVNFSVYGGGCLNHKSKSDLRICQYIINTIGEYLKSKGLYTDKSYRYYAANYQSRAELILKEQPFE